MLPLEPVDAWCREIRALRICTAVWDALAGNDAAELRRLLPHPEPDVSRQGRDFLERRMTEKTPTFIGRQEWNGWNWLR